MLSPEQTTYSRSLGLSTLVSWDTSVPLEICLRRFCESSVFDRYVVVIEPRWPISGEPDKSSLFFTPILIGGLLRAFFIGDLDLLISFPLFILLLLSLKLVFKWLPIDKGLPALNSRLTLSMIVLYILWSLTISGTLRFSVY